MRPLLDATPLARAVVRGASVALACVASTAPHARAAAPAARVNAASVEPLWTWAPATASPDPVVLASLTDREAALQAHCGASERGLRAVAERLALRKTRELPYLDLDGLAFAQRAAGEPHVWPRAWIVSGRALDHDSTLAKLDAWRLSFRDIGERRCGVAIAYGTDGTEVVAAVALDAVADLLPLPLRAHAGSWLTVDATMLVPASGAHVIVLGPGGEPRRVPTSFESGRVRARFAPERAGVFTVQVVADVLTGPRPVLEAQLFADSEPPLVMPRLEAPGEEAGAPRQGVEPKEALTESLSNMVLALRAYEGLPPPARDARLDAIARAHAARMQSAHTLAHDVGDGDPAARLDAASLVARETGENVAHAQSVTLAHRALYASPSHRANLLRPEFDRIGIAVVADPDGSVWVDEVFAAGLR